MTLQAQRVDVGDVQQAGVGRAVRGVAPDAAVGLDHGMLVNEGPGCFRMALHAHIVLVGAGLELLALKCSVGIVTIAATDQPFVHFVMKGLCERRLNICVAAIAELRLRGPEEVRVLSGQIERCRLARLRTIG